MVVALGWAFAALLTLLLLACAIALSRAVASRRRWQRQAEKMRSASQERMDQLAVISHEMRTPLALILGPVQLLLEQTPGTLTDTQQQFLSTIRANAEHLQAITESILQQSRIEAGMFTMREENVDLRAMGLRVVTELRTLHEYSIAYDCPGVPPIVRGDPHLLHQAITNLLSNACRYSGSDLVVLRVQRQSTKTLVSIEDRGLGMSRHQRDAAFQAYRTSGSSRGGVGLGLLIAKEIARLHGGKLHMQTTLNAGTVVTFAVPNAEPQSWTN